MAGEKNESGARIPIAFPSKTGRLPGFVIPTPSPEGFMSTSQKMTLTDVALALRDEQLEAQVIHYKADLATNAELDAITAQVVSELQGLQAAARAAAPPSKPVSIVDRKDLEIELIQSLKTMLARLFQPGKLNTRIERRLGEVAKRFARLFFESELTDRIRGDAGTAKAMRFADQSLYHALTRVEDQVFAELDKLAYAMPETKDRAKSDFLELVKGMRNAFLARSTPELNFLVKHLNEVLTRFFLAELPPQLGDLAWEVVRDARLAEANTIAGYKISASAFPAFRSAFERRFLTRLVNYVEDEMLRRVRDTKEFRDESIQLVARPEIFSEVCEVMCEGVYDGLYNDGFLDLPGNWRKRLSR